MRSGDTARPDILAVAPLPSVTMAARVLAALGADNAVLLPHIGSASEITRQAMGQAVVDNLTSWFASGKPLSPVAETRF